MRLSKSFYIVAVSTALLLSSCGKVTFDKKHDSSKETPPAAPPRSNPMGLTWETVPSKFNPDVIHENFVTDGVETISMNSFWFGSDVGLEVLYKPNMTANTGYLDLYTVGNGGFGTFAPSVKGTTLSLERNGSYECEIRAKDGQITEVKGGCVLFAKVILPVGSEIEVYNQNKLLTRRFRPMSVSLFLDMLEHATYTDEKLKVIDDFKQSFADTSKAVVITAADLGQVLDNVSFDKDKLEALRRLQGAVSDRAELPKVIDEAFLSSFSREEARKICGL